MRSVHICGLILALFAAPSIPCADVTSGHTDTLKVIADTLKVVADDTAKVLTKSPAGAMLRSAALPGWGQFYNEKYIKGALILSLESFFMAGALVEHRNFVRENRSWSSIHRERRNDFLIWLVGTILFSMADAYVDAHLYRFDDDFERLRE